ncbi:MAG TPA: response regulator [Egicoccus sp.]|nr:response regulator [Egicoccus sp.]HSK22723.1 response regulator [Egicoccus sp.]
MLTMTTQPMTGPTTETVRVAIVDDDPGIRTVLRLLLAASGRAVLVAEADGEDTAAVALRRASPDIVLLDHDLGRSCGLALVPSARELCPDAMVAVFSAKPAELAASASLRAGADRYYEKSLLGATFVDHLAADLADHRRRTTG